jgi:hypothetical protein
LRGEPARHRGWPCGECGPDVFGTYSRAAWSCRERAYYCPGRRWVKPGLLRAVIEEVHSEKVAVRLWQLSNLGRPPRIPRYLGPNDLFNTEYRQFRARLRVLHSFYDLFILYETHPHNHPRATPAAANPPKALSARLKYPPLIIVALRFRPPRHPENT